MLDRNISDDLLMNLIKKYSPAYIWAPANCVFFNTYLKIFSYQEYSLYELGSQSKYDMHNDLALLLTTSGSTGSPKFVRLSYENITTNAQSICQYLAISNKDRPVTTLPMHYSFGLSIINSHLISGSTILLTNHSLFEKEFWQFVTEFKATSISGVPYLFEILKKLRFFKMDLPYLTTLTQAGGKLCNKLNAEFAEFCKNNRKNFFVMYGQTEATARMSYLPSYDANRKIGSIGIPIPGGQFSLIDEEGKLINASNQEGELIYHGANVCMGYSHSRFDLNKGNENNGTLHTGDIAKKDLDGYYYIVGRKKRFIKIFGTRVSLDEAENLLNKKFSNCICTGKDDTLSIFTTNKSQDSNEIKNYISDLTGINQRAFKVHYISEIPRDASGKLLYSKLK